MVVRTEEINQPSCIPDDIVLPENSTFFAVFVGVEFTIEASVANGINLTFTFVTTSEDGNEEQNTDRPCDLTCDKSTGDEAELCHESHKVSKVHFYLHRRRQKQV